MAWILLWKGSARVYYNAKEDWPLVWSVDDGKIENEYKVSNVGLFVSGFRTMARTEDMPVQPKVWLEYDRCQVYIEEETRRVKITIW
jgi:hypothetical protein